MSATLVSGGVSGWISTVDKLPEEQESGLCVIRRFDEANGSQIVVPFTFIDGDFHPFADEDSQELDDYWVDPLYWPDHWRPFPSPPTT